MPPHPSSVPHVPRSEAERGSVDQLTLSDFAPAALRGEDDDLRDLARLDGVPEPLFHLVTNNPKKPDLIADYHALRQLLAEGYTEHEITSATGLNRPAIARRLKLGDLHPDLLTAAQSGTISPSVAEACAKLPLPLQAELVEAINAKGKLTAHDVSEARRARAHEATAALPADLFTTESPLSPQGRGAGGEGDWHAAARTSIEQALKLIPETAAPSVRDALTEALADLDFITAAEESFTKK